MTAVIRQAQAADLPALTRVFHAAWHTAYDDVVPPEVLAGMTEAAVTELLATAAAETELRTDVALDAAGEVIGFTRFGADPIRPGPANGHIAALYVHPAAGSSGVGRALLEHALQAMHDAGRDDVTLWVFAGNGRARRLYESAGFRPDGTEFTDPRWSVPQLRYRRAG
ncbi:MAG TPA: GNAT family N-acetyltransferase [Jatrophihabitans sp.]|nr:GNAT family N-acetyltransferase [Jatrophihabitans sp.]